MIPEQDSVPLPENENYLPRFNCTKLKTLLKKNIVYLPKSRIPQHTVKFHKLALRLKIFFFVGESE